VNERLDAAACSGRGNDACPSCGGRRLDGTAVVTVWETG
jgi:hypothetical protein